MPKLTIEPTGESDAGTCDCCGQKMRRVSGLVYADQSAHAAYIVHWTDEGVIEHGSGWDIVIGKWGEDSNREDKFVVRLLLRNDEEKGFAVMDADPAAFTGIASNALRRDDVIGGPLAKEVFAICDAIVLQDTRVAHLVG